MNTPPNVFAHRDNTISAPLCPLGVSTVRAWFAGHPIYDEGFNCCDNFSCTCHNDELITRKGTPQEKNEFYSMAQQEIYS